MKSNLMIPKIKPNGQKDFFGQRVPSTLSSQLSLPDSTDFNKFNGIPRAWYSSNRKNQNDLYDENDEDNISYY
jgi:hypothetical protein